MIPKSRYDTIDCFLASSEYNDEEVLYDEDVFKELKDGGREIGYSSLSVALLLHVLWEYRT